MIASYEPKSFRRTLVGLKRHAGAVRPMYGRAFQTDLCGTKELDAGARCRGSDGQLSLSTRHREN